MWPTRHPGHEAARDLTVNAVAQRTDPAAPGRLEDQPTIWELCRLPPSRGPGWGRSIQM